MPPLRAAHPTDPARPGEQRTRMQANITFRGMEPTDSLKAYVVERIEHVEKYFDRPIEVHAVLSLERYLHHADITIHAGQFLLRGRVKSEDMYKSIDEASEKIERQVKRYKEKLRTTKHRKHDGRGVKVRHEVYEPLPEAAEEATPKVIKSSEFVVKPMMLDEAIMQMDLMDNDFLVFTNVKSGDVNVLFRRKDGNLGLIEAATGKALETEALKKKGARA
jgi:putative sigma-54 modulation protein